MASYNTVIKKRNPANTDWDSILPVTMAENVLIDSARSLAGVEDRASYMAFCAAVNGNSLDAAFGKNNDDYIRNLGYQLMKYARFKGETAAEQPLSNVQLADKYIDIVNSNLLSKELMSSPSLSALVQASAYAFDTIKSKSRTLSDLILYNAGATSYLNLNAATVVKRGSYAANCSFTKNAANLTLYSYHGATSTGNSGVNVSIPFSTVLSNYPLVFYKYLNIMCSLNVASAYQGAGYSASTEDITIEEGTGQGGKVLAAGSVLKSADSFVKLMADAQMGESGKPLVLDLYNGSFNDYARSSSWVITKIWFSET